MACSGGSSDKTDRVQLPFKQTVRESGFYSSREEDHSGKDRLFAVNAGNVLWRQRTRVEMVPSCIHEALASTSKNSSKFVIERL